MDLSCIYQLIGMCPCLGSMAMALINFIDSSLRAGNKHVVTLCIYVYYENKSNSIISSLSRSDFKVRRVAMQT